MSEQTKDTRWATRLQAELLLYLAAESELRAAETDEEIVGAAANYVTRAKHMQARLGRMIQILRDHDAEKKVGDNPQPAASTSPDDSGAGTTDPGPGLRAFFPPTDRHGPGCVATPRVPGSSVPQVPVLEPGEPD